MKHVILGCRSPRKVVNMKKSKAKKKHIFEKISKQKRSG